MRLILVLLLIFVAGCISPPKQLGCCLKENIADGCMLYNTSNFITQDYIANTLGACDDNNSGTLGGCNVSIDGEGIFIPICTEDQIVPCVNGNCTAFVCGDFKYQPRIAPTFTSVEDAEGDVPPDNEEKESTNFYNAQCRFLPMDATLRQIMKNSKSQINVFRIGVGGSFDEYDQYRNFFPISDKFCSTNPNGKVDRFMNYLSWEGGKADEFDPINQMENICIDDSNIPGPLLFTEDYEERDSTAPISNGDIDIEYNTIVPDKSNYKYSHYAVVDLESNYHSGNGGYYSYENPFVNQENIYKKIDKEFYRKELSIAHQQTIYGEDGKTRAPFECSLSEFDCYSGSCDTSIYNRGVMVEASEDLGTNPFEIVTDCNEIYDQNGQKKIFCAPTKSVSFNEGTIPTISSAQVELYPARVTVDADYSHLFNFEMLSQDLTGIERVYDELGETGYLMKGKIYTGTSALGTLRFRNVEKQYCRDYNENNETTKVLCSDIYPSGLEPKLAGIEFFGKMKDGSTVRMPDGSIIIGYAISSNEDFSDIELVEKCELAFNSSNPYIDNNFQFELKTAACTDYCKMLATNVDNGCTGSYNHGDYFYANDTDCVNAHKADPNYYKRCLDGFRYSDPNCLQKSGNGLPPAPINQIKYNSCMAEKDTTAQELCADYDLESDLAFNGCKQDCMDYCQGANSTKCEDYCNDGIAGNQEGIVLDPCYMYGDDSPQCLNYVAPAPLICNVPGSSNPDNVIVSDDFFRIEFNRPGDKIWKTMTTVFKPYFSDKVKNGFLSGGFEDGCGKFILGEDAAFATIPWIIEYNKTIKNDGDSIFNNFHLSAPYAQALRERNIYDKKTVTNPGTSSCEIRHGAPYPTSLFFSDISFNFDIAYSKYLYVFRYTPGSEKIGKCAVDDTTYLPIIKTFGWCDACTTSTLAYQKITADDEVYLPYYKARVDDDEYSNPETICSIKYDFGFTGAGVEVSDNITCFNKYITDIDDYKESIGGMGSPRTNPEASILKERLGNYMKSGIMPVIDMSSDSNWNITNPDAGPNFGLWWFGADFGSDDEYLEYDFERLFGEMGASIVIVERISSTPNLSEIESILERAATLKENCFGCMAAVQVDNTNDVEQFRTIIEPLLSHPTASYNIDLITMDYELSEHTSVGQYTFSDYTVVDDIAAFGRTSLTTPSPGRGKPLLITKFNIRDDDARWGESNYDELFKEIVDRQDELIKSGVIGLIYSPVREDEIGSTNIGSGLFGILGSASAASDGKGIVTVGDDGVGEKGAKFCAMQEAMYRMTVNPPTTIFNKILAVENVTCERCTGLDKTLGKCGLTCSNGNDCIIPDDATDSTNYKCPLNTLPGDCTLCKDISGSFTCTKTHANGTVEMLSGDMSIVSSDLYMDIIGGLPDGKRCCLEDSIGTRYSYYATSYERAINKPVVFPKSGDPNLDCGIGDANDITKLTSFCSIETVPLKEYKIECEIN